MASVAHRRSTGSAPSRGATSPTPSRERCACAADLAPEQCEKLRDEVTVFEMDHLAELGRFHQLAVDAYGAQHADPASIRLPYSLVGLYFALEMGFDGLRPYQGRRVARTGVKDADVITPLPSSKTSAGGCG